MCRNDSTTNSRAPQAPSEMKVAALVRSPTGRSPGRGAHRWTTCAASWVISSTVATDESGGGELLQALQPLPGGLPALRRDSRAPRPAPRDARRSTVRKTGARPRRRHGFPGRRATRRRLHARARRMAGTCTTARSSLRGRTPPRRSGSVRGSRCATRKRAPRAAASHRPWAATPRAGFARSVTAGAGRCRWSAPVWRAWADRRRST